MRGYWSAGFLAVATALLTSPALAVQEDVNAAASHATPLSSQEIYRLYGNRSWLWGRNGAGYFAIRKRAFTAWTRNKAGKGYGEGIWFIPRDGRLCFRASWQDPKSTSTTLTCFDHRADAKAIYQRKAPSGSWYIFKHRHPRRSDEFEKLKYGNYVARKYMEIKSELR
jgi:hypothetical protein